MSLVPTLGIGNGRVLAKFETWNREWRSSSQVRDLESGTEEFEQSLKHRIGNGGVRAKFDAWNRKLRSSSQVPMVGIGNGRVRDKFDASNRK